MLSLSLDLPPRAHQAASKLAPLPFVAPKRCLVVRERNGDRVLAAPLANDHATVAHICDVKLTAAEERSDGGGARIFGIEAVLG